MKKIVFPSIVLFAIFIASVLFQSFTNGSEPWSQKQLMQPADLAKVINDGNKEHWQILSVGPSAIIKTSVDIGQCRNTSNVADLKSYLNKQPKDANIVIYCGCCPFVNCPNIRPAFNLLNEMKFTNHKLLNLPKNIKTDWIDKGYPMAD